MSLKGCRELWYMVDHESPTYRPITESRVPLPLLIDSFKKQNKTKIHVNLREIRLWSKTSSDKRDPDPNTECKTPITIYNYTRLNLLTYLLIFIRFPQVYLSLLCIKRPSSKCISDSCGSKIRNRFYSYGVADKEFIILPLLLWSILPTLLSHFLVLDTTCMTYDQLSIQK